MLNNKSILKVKGILSAKKGTQIPKHDRGSAIAQLKQLKSQGLPIDERTKAYLLREGITQQELDYGVIDESQGQSQSQTQGGWGPLPAESGQEYKSGNSAITWGTSDTTQKPGTTYADIAKSAVGILTPKQQKAQQEATASVSEKEMNDAGKSEEEKTEEKEKQENSKLAAAAATKIISPKVDTDPKKIGETETEGHNGETGDYNYWVPEPETTNEKIAARIQAFGDRVKNWSKSESGKAVGGMAKTAGKMADIADTIVQNNKDFAEDDWSNGKGRDTYDAISTSLMAFSPIGTIVGGAMKVGALVNDLAGGKTQDFSVDRQTLDQVGGSYGGSSASINDAAAHAGKDYGLLALGQRNKQNKKIDEARRQQSAMSKIAKDSYDMQSASTIMSNYNNLGYQYQMNGGYDQRYLRAAKSGTKIQYFKDPFKVELSDIKDFSVELQDVPSLLKRGGTLLDKLDTKYSIKFEVILSDVNTAESFKKGGVIKDREIEVIETNTSQKSVIPEGALHKNKHHLDQVGVDDSELTKKGIPVVDNDGDQQAEIELNEIIFTLEVTKELESRYKEFYAEGTSKSKQDELAIEAGKLLWKEILYNTDDRTGLIDTLKKGGTIQKDPRKPAYKDWVSDVNPAFINDNYDLETAYKYLPYEQLQRWKMAVNSENPDYYLNYQDPKTGEYIYHLGSIAPYGDGDYIFLKKGKEKDNPELHWETDTYHDGSNGLKETHDLVYDKESGRYFYRKKKSAAKHQFGGNITQDDINQMVKQALINLLIK